jgi:PAS domain S-box-containing protein
VNAPDPTPSASPDPGHETAQALLRSEALLRATLDSIDDGVLVVSAAGRISHYNTRFLDIWSVPPALASSRDDRALLAHVAPQLVDPDSFSAGVETIYHTDAKTHDTLHFKDGRIIERFSAPVGAPGADNERMWLFRDVTARVQAEKALRDREARLQSIFRAAPTTIGVVANRVFQEVNDTTCRLTGYSREELIGKFTRILYATDEDFAAASAMYDQLAEKPIIVVETRWRRKDGTMLDILLSGAPLVPDDPAQGVTFIGLDITERKRTEERFRQLAAEQRVVLDTITTGIGLVKNRQHQWINRSLVQMFGYSLEELKEIGTAGNYADPADYRRVGEEGYAALAAGRIYSTEARMKRRDGTTIWCEITGKAIDPSNLQAGSIWALLDITERKRTETALRESEVAFRSLFEASPTPIVLLVDRVFLRVNPMMCQITGYTEAELLGQSARLLYPDDATFDRVGAELYGNIHRDGIGRVETRMRRKNGDPIDMLISVSFLDPAAPAKGIAATLLDITERKLAEERYRTIIQTTVDGFWILTPDGHIQSTNDAICRMLGYTAEELLEKPVHTIVTDETAAEVSLHLTRIAGTGLDRFETRLQRKDGGILDADISINHLPGNEPRFFVFIRDISERKIREEALRRSEERFRLAIEHTGQLVFDFDIATGRGSWAGDTEAMLGYSRGFLDSHDPAWWLEQVHTEDRAALAEGWQAILHHTHSLRAVYRFMRADGIWIHLMATSVHIGDADGQPHRILGAVADVTKQQEDAEAIHRLNTELEQRVRDRTAQLEHLNADLQTSQDSLAQAASRLQEANANLLAANQELESFSYSISHDLRSPLRNIAGFIELLRRRTAGQLDSEADRYFGIVGTEAVRMAALIDDLLTFSRIGRTELHFAPVQLATLVAEVQAELQSDLTGRLVEWRLQPLPPVLGDRTLLRQVVANLVANAVKFTRQRHPAIIEIGAQPAAQDPELLTFFVRDNGAGFDPKYAAKLFGVFQRLHNPRDFEGTGIGLANVKRIVTRHGGHVWAEGVPNQGATFYFSLRPASPPAVAP